VNPKTLQTSKMGSVAIAGTFFVAALAASTSVGVASPTAGTMRDDFAYRSPDIHWPAGFEPATADLLSHNELVIGASCERVWQHIVNAAKWPQWNPNAKDVQMTGDTSALAAGAVFRWTTFGLAIESRINEFVPHTRIGWYGSEPGTAPLLSQLVAGSVSDEGG
jgi:hypothetical protein